MTNSNKPKSTWEKTRKFFNDIHLWAGLISGLVLVVVCFTGTVYVYNTEIRESAAKHLYQVSPEKGAARLGLTFILESTAKQVEGEVISVTVPFEANRSVQINVKKEGDQSRSGTTYFVNPYTGAILGNNSEPTWADNLMKDLFSLHRWLMLDRIEKPLIGELPNRNLGSYITGTATILFTIGVITGMIIWFPRKIKNWKQGLKIKTGNWKRTNHDLHNSLAFYSIIFLFMMGATGPFWSFPWYREALQRSLGTYKEQPTENRSGNVSTKMDSDGEQSEALVPLDLEKIVQVSDKVLDYEGSYRISFPQKPEDLISISKYKVGFFAPAAADKIQMKSDLEIDEVQIFKGKPFNERISSSIKSIHIGDVYGSFSKILYFLACLVATSLPFTGTLIWINKMKKKKKTSRTAKEVLA
ncbi:PepSY-associated TM helix domain-containing protein [Aquiflexum gelatinilyticum]|uniref:PepSY-associated TM helix domain-containing protein n=1 Tax=Aquiflexum gelatinilyticum TaxID=2961943 RepID=UPI00216AA7FA|nr:PepSY-associated TM helix domain-containing protein [Aquiflexum gelatinilyticum]MCS4433551.1 PepSY domain-containing protein [Aquiflexum gelatinilyticum]